MFRGNSCTNGHGISIVCFPSFYIFFYVFSVQPHRDLLILVLPSLTFSSRKIPSFESKVKYTCRYMGEYQIILVQWPGLAYQDKIICIRQQSDEYHVFCKYYLFLRRFSHWHHKGNTATGMRRFGVLIDQVRFQEYITAAPKLICYLFDRATQRPSKLPAVA